ncbi:MAG: hypothetical protein IPJ03_06115 [Ignavibacteriales bacterium]|nr:hypothetical protein [Ignavibacteriales bacterium]
MRRKQKVFGLIEFSEELVCAADSLGKSVIIVLSNHEATLTLPSLPNWLPNEKDPLSKCLIGPKPADKWKSGNEPILWGKPFSYPEGTSEVNFAFLEFIIDSSLIDEVSKEIYLAFPDWLNLFEKYTKLLTKQHTKNQVFVKNEPPRLKLISQESNKLKKITSNFYNEIAIVDWQEDTSLHYNQLVTASQFSSKRLKPRLEYELLLDAYVARSKDDYRKVILEGASALEVCLTSRIQNEFESLKIKFGSKLLDKFRMLGGRFELIRLLGIELPDKDYEKIIIKPRNDVVHKAKYPDLKTAYSFINEVESLICILSPQLFEN